MADTVTETKPKRWYIVHAYSNFENKVADSIREQAKQRGLEELFEQEGVGSGDVVRPEALSFGEKVGVGLDVG